jgi:hypothetical protein
MLCLKITKLRFWDLKCQRCPIDDVCVLVYHVNGGLSSCQKFSLIFPWKLPMNSSVNSSLFLCNLFVMWFWPMCVASSWITFHNSYYNVRVGRNAKGNKEPTTINWQWQTSIVFLKKCVTFISYYLLFDIIQSMGNLQVNCSNLGEVLWKEAGHMTRFVIFWSFYSSSR